MKKKTINYKDYVITIVNRENDSIKIEFRISKTNQKFGIQSKELVLVKEIYMIFTHNCYYHDGKAYSNDFEKSLYSILDLYINDRIPNITNKVNDDFDNFDEDDNDDYVNEDCSICGSCGITGCCGVHACAYLDAHQGDYDSMANDNNALREFIAHEFKDKVLFEIYSEGTDQRTYKIIESLSELDSSFEIELINEIPELSSPWKYTFFVLNSKKHVCGYLYSNAFIPVK